MKIMNYKILFLALLPSLLAAQNQSGQTGPAQDREQAQVDFEPLWRQALGGAVTGLPTTQVNSVVMTLDGGNVKAYSSSGRPLWNYSARGRLSPFVTRSREGASYISRTNGILIAINRAGRELWRRNPGGPLSGAVVVGWDGRLFVPAGKKIACYTAAGSPLWSREFEHAIAISPRLDQSGGIVCALENGELLQINPFGTVTRRSLETAAQALVSLENGRYLAISANGGLAFFNFSQTAAETPPPPSAAPLPSPPLAATSRGNTAAICLTDGRTILLSGDDGTILWTGESHIAIKRRNGGGQDNEAAILYDERGIYVLSQSGATGFAEDGRRLWFTTLENTAALPAFGDDGILYAGGLDWILYAYRLEERTRQEKQSLYGPAPSGSYGLGSPPPSPWADDHFRFEENQLRPLFEHITASIKTGNIGENETEWTAYLMETAWGEYNRSATLAPIQYRVTALQLLAQIGSRETIPYLVSIFKLDKEPVIRAAAADAIGTIGIDPEGIALSAFTAAISPAAPFKDEQALVSVASATGALCRFSGPPLSNTGVRILTLLTTATQPKSVQRQALKELQSLHQ